MRRLLLIYFFGFMSTAVPGQYVPNNGQAFQFASITNPAFSGVEGYADLKLSYRHQWSGFGAYSPKYMNLSFNTRLKHPIDLKSNSIRMSNPSLVLPENLPKRKRIIIGFGGNLFHSEVGLINSIGGSLNFSWNYPLSKKLRLSLGVSPVIESRKLQLDDITFHEPDPFYNHLLTTSSSSQVDLSVRGGMLLYTRGFYLGASYLPIVNKPIQASDVALEDPFYRASFQTGFSFNTSPSLSFKPSVLAFLLMDNSLAIDYNIKAYVQDKGWLGLTYRDSETGIFLIGLNVTEFLNATYSYEVSFGGFQTFGGSSHELVLGLRINNFRKVGAWTW